MVVALRNPILQVHYHERVIGNLCTCPERRAQEAWNNHVITSPYVQTKKCRWYLVYKSLNQINIDKSKNQKITLNQNI